MITTRLKLSTFPKDGKPKIVLNQKRIDLTFDQKADLFLELDIFEKCPEKLQDIANRFHAGVITRTQVKQELLYQKPYFEWAVNPILLERFSSFSEANMEELNQKLHKSSTWLADPSTPLDINVVTSFQNSSEGVEFRTITFAAKS